MVRLVDKNRSNYLYRGPIPKTEIGEFDCKGLIETFTETPDNYRLIIFSFLTHERADETAFLCQITQMRDPPRCEPIQIEAGTVYFWQVRAHTREEMCVEGQVFEGHRLKFPQLIETIHALMMSEEPTVIYIHCRHGLNRTGAVTTAYLMRRFGMSLDEAFAKNMTFHPTHKPTFIYNPDELLFFLDLYGHQCLM